MTIYKFVFETQTDALDAEETLINEGIKCRVVQVTCDYVVETEDGRALELFKDVPLITIPQSDE